MPQIKLVANGKQLKEFVDSFTNEVLVKAAIRAINRTAITARQEAVNAVKEQLKLPVGKIRDSFRIKNATETDRDATLSAIGKPLPLFLFSPRQKIVQTRTGKKKQVSVDISGKRTVVQGGFTSAMPSGRIGIFKRKRPSRLPIVELFTGSVAKIFASDKVQARVREKIAPTFVKNFEQDFEFFKKKLVR